MSELPEGWAKASLGEIVSLRGDKALPSSLPKLPFVGLEQIEPHTSRIIEPPLAGTVNSSVARFSSGEVLYSRLRPYLNKVSVPDFEGVASAEVLVLKPSAATTAEFVRRRIMCAEFLDFAASLDKGDRPRVNFREIAGFSFGLPPLAEQERIVAKLDSLLSATARARKELDAIPALIAAQKRALLSAAFTGELTADWRESNADVTPWHECTLGDISEIQSGVALGKKRTGVSQLVSKPYLRVANVQRGHLDLVEVKETFVTPMEAEKLRLKHGDILMNEGGDRDKLGRGWVWEGQIEDCIHQNHVFRVRLKDGKFPPRFVSYYANEFGAVHFAKEGTQTTNLASISKAALSRLPIRMPSNAEATEVVRLIEIGLAVLDRIAAEHARAMALLPNLEQAILARAFEGRLVPQDPNDEPASILLDRIKAERAAITPEKRGRGRPKTQKEPKTMMSLTDQLRLECEEWPAKGLSFEELRKRKPGAYDPLKEAIFELLQEETPVLEQAFDPEARVMRLRKIAA